MTVSKLTTAVRAALAQPKIDATAARQVLGIIEKDSRYSPQEIKALKEIASLPRGRFQNSTEYWPNPYDPEDGVDVKLKPHVWFDESLARATATLKVRRTIPELSFSLSNVKKVEVDDFGDYLTRTLSVTFKGQKASRAGAIEVEYGNRKISLPVKKGEDLGRLCNKLETRLMHAERGSLSIRGWFDPNKAGSQTLTFEVL